MKSKPFENNQQAGQERQVGLNHVAVGVDADEIIAFDESSSKKKVTIRVKQNFKESSENLTVAQSKRKFLPALDQIIVGSSGNLNKQFLPIPIH